MKLRITHETQYSYSPTVVTAQHVAHLEPVNTPCQTCLSHVFRTLPDSPKRRRQTDAFGNQRVYFSLPVAHNTLQVHAQSTLETCPLPLELATSLQDHGNTLTWDQAQEAYAYRAGQASDDATPFAYPSHHAPVDQAFKRYALGSFAPGRPLLEAVRDLMQRIHTEFNYESFSTDISTPALTVLSNKRGVCQDFAHVMLACLRSMGLAARYVSGYLLTDPPPDKPASLAAMHPMHGSLCACPTGMQLRVQNLGTISIPPTIEKAGAVRAKTMCAWLWAAILQTFHPCEASCKVARTTRCRSMSRWHRFNF